jgi:hypothetical protein
MRALAAALVVACSLVPQASAKGPISLCGAGSCAELAASVRWWPDAFDSHVRPVAPVPFFKLTWGHPGVLAYWIPSTGVLRLAPQGGGAMWVRPTVEEAEELARASAGLTAFAAPTRVTVTVNDRSVQGDASYLRLFTMGRSVTTPAPARRWLPVDFWGAETPWTQCMYCLWISRTGAWLRRADGDVVAIPMRIANRVRARQPLTG